MYYLHDGILKTYSQSPPYAPNPAVMAHLRRTPLGFQWTFCKKIIAISCRERLVCKVKCDCIFFLVYDITE